MLNENEDDSISVFLASDDTYAPFVATTITSIMDNTREFIDFFILDSGISNQNKKRIEFIQKIYPNFSIEYIDIDLQELFGNFPLHSESHTLNVFSRYLIPQLKPELKKVLYLDADIIVKGDLAELYNEDLGNYHLGAIPEYTDVLEEHKKSLKISTEHKYFNAGILLIDCVYFRENNLTSILIEKTLDIKPQLQDQDIFNIHFQNDYKILDYKYNVSLYMQNYNKKVFNKKVKKAIDNPYIIHYSTFKPWVDVSVIFGEYFWYYAKKTVFYEELLKNIRQKELKSLVTQKFENNKEYTKKIKLLGRVPCFIIRKRQNYTKIYVLNVPLFKIRHEEHCSTICLFSWKIIFLKVYKHIHDKNQKT